jgi:hypothetical protein
MTGATKFTRFLGQGMMVALAAVCAPEAKAEQKCPAGSQAVTHEHRSDYMRAHTEIACVKEDEFGKRTLKVGPYEVLTEDGHAIRGQFDLNGRRVGAWLECAYREPCQRGSYNSSGRREGLWKDSQGGEVKYRDGRIPREIRANGQVDRYSELEERVDESRSPLLFSFSRKIVGKRTLSSEKDGTVLAEATYSEEGNLLSGSFRYGSGRAEVTYSPAFAISFPDGTRITGAQLVQLNDQQLGAMLEGGMLPGCTVTTTTGNMALLKAYSSDLRMTGHIGSLDGSLAVPDQDHYDGYKTRAEYQAALGKELKVSGWIPKCLADTHSLRVTLAPVQMVRLARELGSKPASGVATASPARTAGGAR